MMNRNMIIATGLGLAAQLAMVLVGHTDAGVAAMFAPLGITISLVAGALYAWLARPGLRQGAVGGATAGACARCSASAFPARWAM